MLWVLKRTVSMRRFFWAPKTYIKPFITTQTLHHSDTAPSVIEQNVTDVTAQQEWETEWNQAGLASRLSEQVTRPLDKSA